LGLTAEAGTRLSHAVSRYGHPLLGGSVHRPVVPLAKRRRTAQVHRTPDSDSGFLLLAPSLRSSCIIIVTQGSQLPRTDELSFSVLRWEVRSEVPPSAEPVINPL
jgi:hypothetical protein